MSDARTDGGRTPLAYFTILDWLGVTATGFSTLPLLGFAIAGPRARAVFDDVGGELPLLTLWVMQPWFPITLGIVSLAILMAAFRKDLSIGRRRMWVVASFVMTSTFVALCLIGLYLPIFIMADAIAAH